MNYITTSRKPSTRVRTLAKNLAFLFNAEFVTRGKNSISDLIADCRYNGVENVLIITEKDGNPKQILLMSVNDKTWEWKETYFLKLLVTRSEILKEEGNLRLRTFVNETPNKALRSLLDNLGVEEDQDSEVVLKEVKKGISIFLGKKEIGPVFDISFSSH